MYDFADSQKRNKQVREVHNQHFLIGIHGVLLSRQAGLRVPSGPTPCFQLFLYFLLPAQLHEGSCFSRIGGIQNLKPPLKPVIFQSCIFNKVVGTYI